MYPEEHSQSGIRPYLGSGLPDVEPYDGSPEGPEYSRISDPDTGSSR